MRRCRGNQYRQIPHNVLVCKCFILPEPPITVWVTLFFFGFLVPFFYIRLGGGKTETKKEKRKKIDYFQLVIHLICRGSGLSYSQLPLVNLIWGKNSITFIKVIPYTLVIASEKKNTHPGFGVKIVGIVCVCVFGVRCWVLGVWRVGGQSIPRSLQRQNPAQPRINKKN